MSYIFIISVAVPLLIIVFYSVSFIRVINYEKKILKYKRRINGLPKEVRQRTDGMPVNQQQCERMIKNEQKPLLQELETI